MKNVLSKIILICFVLLLAVSNVFLFLTISSEPAEAASESTYLNLGNSTYFSLFDASQLNKTFTYDYETPRYLYLGFGGSSSAQFDYCNYLLSEILYTGTSIMFYFQHNQGLFLLENVATLDGINYPASIVTTLPSGSNPYVLAYCYNDYNMTSNTVTSRYSYYVRIPFVSNSVKLIPLSTLNVSNYVREFQQNYSSILNNSKIFPLDYQALSPTGSRSLNNSAFSFNNYAHSSFSDSLFSYKYDSAWRSFSSFDSQSAYTVAVSDLNFYEYLYPGLKSILFESVTVNNWVDFLYSVGTSGTRLSVNGSFVNARPLIGTVDTSPVFNEFLIDAVSTYPLDVFFQTNYHVTALGYPGDQITIVNQSSFDFGSFGAFFTMLGSSFEGFFKILSISLFGIPLGVLLFLPLFASIIIFTIKIIRG